MEVNDRSSIISRLQSRVVKIDDFNWDKMSAPPLYSLLPPEACQAIYRIATSIKYSGNARKRYQKIDDILTPYGFEKKGAGTNRVVYKYLENNDFLLKVATDAVGVNDNPKEFKNQFLYKPYVTKIFEVDQTGAVALIERVTPITSREEFTTVASDIYDIIRHWFIGDYIMADIGTKFFMNWGYRKGFGPVLLDFPYVYELDGNKLYCNAVDQTTGCRCGGVIDYDDGYNFLYCTKCGKRYMVKSLAKATENSQIIMKGGKTKMQVITRKGDRIINSTVTGNTFKEEKDSVQKNTAPDTSKEVGRLVARGTYVKDTRKSNNNNRRDQQQNNKENNTPNRNRNDHHKNGANNRGSVRVSENFVPKAKEEPKALVGNGQYDAITAEVEKLKAEIKQLRDDNEALKKSNNELIKNFDKKQDECKQADAVRDQALKDYDDMEAKFVEADKKATEANERIKKLEEDLKFSEDKNETLQNQYDELVKVMDTVADNAANNGPESEMYKDLMAKYDSEKSKSNSLDMKVKDLEAKLEELRDENVKLNDTISDKDDEINKVNNLFEELKNAREAAEDEEEEETPYIDIPFNPAEVTNSADEEKREKEYMDKLDAVDGIRSMVCELTTVNTLNFSKGKELLGKDEYVLVVKNANKDNYILDGGGNNYCISKIGAFTVPELFEDQELFNKTSREVELARSLPTTS